MNTSGNRWLFLLLPVSVMVLSLAYSLVMMVHVPVIVDVFEVDPISWSLERPMDNTEFSDMISNIYRADFTILNFSLRWFEYKEGGRFGGGDEFIIVVNATGDVNDGFVHSVDIKFSVEDENAILRIEENPGAWGNESLRNCVLQEIGYHKPVSYVRVRGVGESFCSMRAQGYWVFLDQFSYPYEVDHQITMVMDAVWFNGTAYLRTILPIQLEVTVT